MHQLLGMRRVVKYGLEDPTKDTGLRVPETLKGLHVYTDTTKSQCHSLLSAMASSVAKQEVALSLGGAEFLCSEGCCHYTTNVQDPGTTGMKVVATIASDNSSQRF